MRPEIQHRIAVLRRGIVVLALPAIFVAMPCGVCQQEQTAKPAPQQLPAAVTQDQQMAADSAELVKLATELKALVDRSSKNTLSIGVIRKAEEVEHAARGVKDKFRLEAASPVANQVTSQVN